MKNNKIKDLFLQKIKKNYISSIQKYDNFSASNYWKASILKKNKLFKIHNLKNFRKNGLSKNIDEEIYERGTRFSGGERQRLSLARALYSDPQILLLDEPSTGLDINSEKKLINSIKKIKGSMVIIIISHKKEIVNICDRVLKLDKSGLKQM